MTNCTTWPEVAQRVITSIAYIATMFGICVLAWRGLNEQ